MLTHHCLMLHYAVTLVRRQSTVASWLGSLNVIFVLNVKWYTQFWSWKYGELLAISSRSCNFELKDELPCFGMPVEHKKPNNSREGSYHLGDAFFLNIYYYYYLFLYIFFNFYFFSGTWWHGKRLYWVTMFCFLCESIGQHRRWKEATEEQNRR